MSEASRESWSQRYTLRIHPDKVTTEEDEVKQLQVGLSANKYSELVMFSYEYNLDHSF